MLGTRIRKPCHSFCGLCLSVLCGAAKRARVLLVGSLPPGLISATARACYRIPMDFSPGLTLFGPGRQPGDPQQRMEALPLGFGPAGKQNLLNGWHQESQTDEHGYPGVAQRCVPIQ